MRFGVSVAIIPFLTIAGPNQTLGFVPSPALSSRALLCNKESGRTQSVVSGMGLIDDLKLIFSEEGKKNRAAYEQREREEMIAAQKEMVERRKNPEKMAEYEQQVQERRARLAKERELWEFQQRDDGGDPLDDWKALREEGKIKVGSDLDRDESSRRLGSEGLVDVRTDERMPYIDQGYVDEDADVLGNIMGMFGGKKYKKKKKDAEEE